MAPVMATVANGTGRHFHEGTTDRQLCEQFVPSGGNSIFLWGRFYFSHFVDDLMTDVNIGIGTTGRSVVASPRVAELGSQGDHPIVPSVGAVKGGATADMVMIRVATGGVSLTPSVPTSFNTVPYSVQAWVFSIVAVTSSAADPASEAATDVRDALVRGPTECVAGGTPVDRAKVAVRNADIAHRSHEGEGVVVVADAGTSCAIYFASLVRTQVGLMLSGP